MTTNTQYSHLMREASEGLTREIVELAGWSFEKEYWGTSYGVVAHWVTRAIESGRGDEEPDWVLVHVICPDQAWCEDYTAGDWDENGCGFDWFADGGHFVGVFPVIHPDGSIHFAQPGTYDRLTPIHGDEATRLRAGLFRRACERLLQKSAVQGISRH